MATLRDVAQLAGTSTAAVSAVLHGGGSKTIRVGAATRARILQAAETLEYRVNSVARSLVTGKTSVLGIVFPYAGGFRTKDDSFSGRCMDGIVHESIRQQFNLMLYTAVGNAWNSLDHTPLLDSRVDGLILVLPTPQSPIIESCRRKRVPYVAVVYGPTDESIYAVNANDFVGGQLATHHLISLGHQRIAHFTGDRRVSTTQERLRGYLCALHEARIPVEDALIVPAGFSHDAGYDSVQTILRLSPEERPTAIFAANDACAHGALKALSEQGMRVPDDIALVGFDDSPIAAAMNPPLTSVYMPVEDLGALATKMLVQTIQGVDVEERQPVLPVQLVVRASSGAARSESR